MRPEPWRRVVRAGHQRARRERGVAIDFQFDSTADGVNFKIPSTREEHTRESLLDITSLIKLLHQSKARTLLRCSISAVRCSFETDFVGLFNTIADVKPLGIHRPNRHTSLRNQECRFHTEHQTALQPAGVHLGHYLRVSEVDTMCGLHPCFGVGYPKPLVNQTLEINVEH